MITLNTLMKQAIMEPLVFITNSLVGSGDTGSVRCGPHSPGTHSPKEKMNSEKIQVNLGLVHEPVDIAFGFAEVYFLTLWVDVFETTIQLSAKS